MSRAPPVGRRPWARPPSWPLPVGARCMVTTRVMRRDKRLVGQLALGLSRRGPYAWSRRAGTRPQAEQVVVQSDLSGPLSPLRTLAVTMQPSCRLTVRRKAARTGASSPLRLTPDAKTPSDRRENALRYQRAFVSLIEEIRSMSAAVPTVHQACWPKNQLFGS